MTLEQLEQQLKKYESDFNTLADSQKQEIQQIELRYQKLHEDQKQKFLETIEKIKQSAISEALAVLDKKTAPQKASFDKRVDLAEYQKFDKHPYFMYPNGKNSYYVLVPKFYPKFQVGWLKDVVDDVWYRYEVNQYSVLFGHVPNEILSQFSLPEPIKAKVDGDKLTFDPADRAFIKKELFRYVADWTDTSARITKGHEFDILDQILQSGYIPFEAKPVRKEHLVKNAGKIKLREYQVEPWNNFLKTGATGNFHPTGSGKSYIGMMGLENIKVENRRNLIISPKITLLDQWTEYLEKEIPHTLENTLITTYQGFKNYDEKFGLTIFDECRRLPATTFARLSTIQTEYRMGMDATPYREDGKNHMIIALTGHPQTINWPEYMAKWGPGYHPIFVHVVPNNRNSKISKMNELYKKSKRTMIYSYTLNFGDEVAAKLGLPFINADTQDRLDVAKQNKSFVASSVFFEGVHLDDLEQIIEIDFHYGSRQEELQLTGRLMHSAAKNKRHDIIMTYDEWSSYSKRLLALEEKGFHVRILENGD